MSNTKRAMASSMTARSEASMRATRDAPSASSIASAARKDTKLRIAQIAPLFESVPPRLYGGTERIVSYLVEELVSQGNSVTLFASGDSVTRAELRSVTPRGLRLDPNCTDSLAAHVRMVDMVASAAAEFDILHFNL